MTWVVVGWCVLILVWAIAGGASNNATAYCEAHPSAYLSLKACEDARNAGTGIGIALILLIGFFGFVFFSFIWLMTRPKRRECPVCGEDVKKGQTKCPSCGHDFAAAAGAPATVGGS
jgi:amino acid transporter